MTNNVKLITILTGVVITCLAAALGTLASNHLGWVLFFTSIGCCIVGLTCLAIARYREVLLAQVNDRSLWIIALALLVIGLVAPVEFLYLSSPLPREHLLQEAGLILFGFGVVLYFWSRSLLEFWKDGESSLDTSRPITRVEAYPVIRFPAYLGLGLSAAGLCLGYSSFIGLSVVLVILIPGIIYRIKLHDKRLAMNV
jgi:protein-S-isoprenylcysteine O-methyltransferase Ste14